MKNTDKYSFDAVILANGDFPSSEYPLQILRGAEYLCCCDAAAVGAIDRGYVPDAIVGDCDSLPDECKKKYRAILHKVDEQDYNDLTKATMHCLDRGFHRIAYLGCTGKREDHSLGNLSQINRFFRDLDVRPAAFTDFGIFLPASGDSSFRSYPGQQISIFNVSCRRLSNEGLKYDSYPYNSLWQGTLNEALGDSFRLSGDGFYSLFFVYGDEPEKIELMMEEV